MTKTSWWSEKTSRHRTLRFGLVIHWLFKDGPTSLYAPRDRTVRIVHVREGAGFLGNASLALIDLLGKNVAARRFLFRYQNLRRTDGWVGKGIRDSDCSAVTFALTSAARWFVPWALLAGLRRTTLKEFGKGFL